MDKNVFHFLILKEYFYTNRIPIDLIHEIISKCPNDILIGSGYSNSFILKNGQLHLIGVNLELGVSDLSCITESISHNIVDTYGHIFKVALGNDHSVILTENGVVYTTGNNEYGQLGLGDKEKRSTFCKVDIPDLIYDIACGLSFTVALTQNGRMYVWAN